MDFSYISFTYGVSFGRGDGSDLFDWDVSLDPEQEYALKKVVFTGGDPDESNDPILTSLRDEVYSDIEENEIDNFLECSDEYTTELQGEEEVDPDEINALVADRNAHALEFFRLTGLSDEELAEWDANEQEELPTVAEFYPDFEPESPLDQGWDLIVNFPYFDESELELEDITDFLEELYRHGDADIAAQVVEYHKDSFDENLPAIAQAIALRIASEAAT